MIALQNFRLSATGTRIYYCFVFGGLGGATGWFIAAMVLHAGAGHLDLFGQAFQGAILGSLIGFSIGAVDGVSFGSLPRAIKFGGVALILGALGGAIALPAAQYLYDTLRPVEAPGAATTGFGSILVGILCWMVFGGLIGLGEGFGKGSQTWKGLLGGLFGGALGGGIYESIGRSTVGSMSPAEQELLALAVCILGGFVGSSIALVTTILKDAWLVVDSGKLKGTEINISKYVDKELGSRRPGIIGSSQWDANIYLPGDSEILGRHASISYKDGLPTLTASPEAVERKKATMVNGRQISTRPLSNGDRLQIGSTTLIYRHKKR